MTPKEKAKELIDKYLCIDEIYNVDLFCDECGMSNEAAKYCALIAVDEIMQAPFENTYLELVPDDAPDSDWFWDTFKEYWNEVKQEIEKL